jgi:hypothetical protein
LARHPKLASDPAFCYRLHVALSRTIAGFVPGYPTSLKWEDLKVTTKYTGPSPLIIRAFIPLVYAPVGSHPFFSVLHSHTDATPLLSSLSLINPPTSQDLTYRAYRVLCLTPASKRHPHLVSSTWFHFWHLTLVSTRRNV